jgi:tellurite methyltransferase
VGKIKAHATTWEQYFETNKGRPVRKLYAQAIKHVVVNQTSTPGSDMAIDIGCGAGNEAVDLLSRGWTVTALDKELSAIQATKDLAASTCTENLHMMHLSIEQLSALPRANFVHSFHTLQLCKPREFDRVWQMIVSAINSGGIFAGTFFGLQDDWVQTGDAIGLGIDELRTRFIEFDVLKMQEIDRIGPVHLGQKHWNYIEVIGQKK